MVYAGFLVLGEQRVLLAVGTCRARLLNTRALLFIFRSGNRDGPGRHQRCCCVEPKIEWDRGAMRILGLVTLRLVSFFRRRRFDLCNQVSISIHLDCISGALHSFSGIITLADHLAGFAVAMSTADNKFTAASTYALENRHHAHSCSVLDFATRAFFIYLEVAPAFVVRRLCGLVCGTVLSLCIAPCLHFCFNSVACNLLFGAGEFIGVRPPVFMFNSALSVRV